MSPFEAEAEAGANAGLSLVTQRARWQAWEPLEGFEGFETLAASARSFSFRPSRRISWLLTITPLKMIQFEGKPRK